jgi:hypothetical protein
MFVIRRRLLTTKPSMAAAVPERYTAADATGDY